VCGALKPGEMLPPLAELAGRYGVAFNTVQRAVNRLNSDGLVTVSRGRRAVVKASEGGQQSAKVVHLQTRRSEIE
jgi:DNA-binding GntR family transcriptional regulator